jgi:hypothetical protein
VLSVRRARRYLGCEQARVVVDNILVTAREVAEPVGFGLLALACGALLLARTRERISR